MEGFSCGGGMKGMARKVPLRQNWGSMYVVSFILIVTESHWKILNKRVGWWKLYSRKIHLMMLNQIYSRDWKWKKSIKGIYESQYSTIGGYNIDWIPKPNCPGSNLVLPFTNFMTSLKLHVPQLPKLEITMILPHRDERQGLITVLTHNNYSLCSLLLLLHSPGETEISLS